MKVTVIGAGYVGLVTAACLADAGNNVLCVESDRKKLSSLKKGQTPFFEPGLSEIVARNLRSGHLKLTGRLKSHIGDVILVAVGTPSEPDGGVNLNAIWEVARAIGDVLDRYAVIAVKSTVPPGTAEKVGKLIRESLSRRKKKIPFDVASNPEFLKEGSAVEDFVKPDRVVVGTSCSKAAGILRSLYAPFMRKKNRFLSMDMRSSEIAKYASNAMLATRISFMNEMADLCEKVGANVQSVREVLGSDPRIGPDFLYPGLGYGGSCFPKDVLGLAHLGQSLGLDLRILGAVHEVNRERTERLVQKMVGHFGGKSGLRGKRIALWGLSFKPMTDDIREAPSIRLIQRLVELGAVLKAYDPVAEKRMREVFPDIGYCEGNYEALKGAHGLVIATEWNEFRSPDFDRMKKLMKHPAVFDGRNLYDPAEMRKKGFHHYGFGRTAQ